MAAFIAYTREALAVGQDEVVELRADRVVVTTFDGEVETASHEAPIAANASEPVSHGVDATPPTFVSPAGR